MSKIDSFTVLTPLDCFTRVGLGFSDTYFEVNEMTGEFREIGKKPIFYESGDGVKFRASIVVLFGKPHLRVTYTTKMLGKDYFVGINVNNFPAIFDRVMKIIDCFIPYAEYCNLSKINDIDFCRDFLLSDGSFSNLLLKYKGVQSARYFYRKKDFLQGKVINGLQFVNRSDASISTPFVKFYTKLDELREGSTLFYDFLIKEGVTVNPDLRRLEVTLKNKRHIESVFKALNIDEKISVFGVLAFSSYRIDTIIDNLLGRYPDNLNNGIMEGSGNPTPDLTPTSWFISSMVELLMQNGFSLKQILFLIDSKPDLSDTSKSRLKSSVKKNFKIYMGSKKIKDVKILLNDAILKK